MWVCLASNNRCGKKLFKFAVTSGSGCTTSGNCFESLNFSNNYGTC